MPWKSLLRNMSKKATKKNAAGTTKAIGQTKMEKTDRLPAAGPIYRDNNGDIRIKVEAKPGAKRNGVTGITEEAVSIAIAAPPIDGEANAELIKYLAAIFSAKKSRVHLDRGNRNRHKIVVISGGESVDLVLEMIKREMNPSGS